MWHSSLVASERKYLIGSHSYISFSRQSFDYLGPTPLCSLAIGFNESEGIAFYLKLDFCVRLEAKAFPNFDWNSHLSFGGNLHSFAHRGNITLGLCSVQL
jgi:hypothetical protein